MDEMFTEILSFLRHNNIEVRKQALTTVFQYSDNKDLIQFILKSDMMKAIKACLYDLVRPYSSLGASVTYYFCNIANLSRIWCTPHYSFY